MAPTPPLPARSPPQLSAQTLQSNHAAVRRLHYEYRRRPPQPMLPCVQDGPTRGDVGVLKRQCVNRGEKESTAVFSHTQQPAAERVVRELGRGLRLLRNYKRMNHAAYD